MRVGSRIVITHCRNGYIVSYGIEPGQKDVCVTEKDLLKCLEKSILTEEKEIENPPPDRRAP